jgi:hypothetical protein
MDFLSDIAGGIQWIADWLNGDTGIYAFFEELLQEAVAWMVIAKLEFMLWTLQFSWGVAKQIMFNLGLGEYLSEAFRGLDPKLMGYLNFFRVPESVNMLVQAYITRFTLRVMGW